MSDTVIVRGQPGGWKTGDYWYSKCTDPVLAPALQALHRLEVMRPAPVTRRMINELARLMNNDYDYMHVRRGDMLTHTKEHPTIDRDTQAAAILKNPVVQQKLRPGALLYIASNERKPGFFNGLAVRYRLASLAKFSSVLETTPPLTPYQHAQIDYGLSAHARNVVETFPDLTT